MMHKLPPRHRRRDERGQPDRFVATVIKSKRKGKILVDYLRNGRGSTAVVPHSTHAAWRRGRLHRRHTGKG